MMHYLDGLHIFLRLIVKDDVDSISYNKWLLVLGLKEGLVECATVCVKSVVILNCCPCNWDNFQVWLGEKDVCLTTKSVHCNVSRGTFLPNL